MSFYFPAPASPSDQIAYNGIKKAYDEIDVASLYWWKIQPLSQFNLAYVNSALDSPRVKDNVAIKTAISKSDTSTLYWYRSQPELHPINLKLINDGLAKIGNDQKAADEAAQNARDKTELDNAFGAKDLAAVERLIARTSPPLSSENMQLAIKIRDYLKTSSSTNISQEDLDKSGIQVAISKGDDMTLKWYRDSKTPPISAENRKTIDDYFVFNAEEVDKRAILKAIGENDTVTLYYFRDTKAPPISAANRKLIDDYFYKPPPAAPPAAPPADPFGPSLSQKDLDMADYQKYLEANDLKSLENLAKRTEPPLDPEVKKLLDEAIAAIKAKYAEMNVAPDFEVAETATAAATAAPTPQAPFRGAVEGFGVGGFMSRAAAAKKIPPKEEEIIGSVTANTPVTPPSANTGLLTDEGWTMLKNLSFNIVKYTGMYIAAPVLAGIVYQYSANQPDGTLLRSLVDIIPRPKLRPGEMQAVMNQSSRVGRLFGEILPDVAKGTTPGKPGGLMLFDEGPLPEARKEWWETSDLVEKFQQVASWNQKDRQLVNDIFPKAPSVLSGRRGSSDISIDNFPVVEYRNKEVANYASGSNASVSGDLLSTALKKLNDKVSSNGGPKKQITPFKTASSLTMGLARGMAPAAPATDDATIVIDMVKRLAGEAFGTSGASAPAAKKAKPTAKTTARGKKQKK